MSDVKPPEGEEENRNNQAVATDPSQGAVRTSADIDSIQERISTSDIESDSLYAFSKRSHNEASLELDEACTIRLPTSNASLASSVNTSREAQVALGSSLEQLMLQPENVPLPDEAASEPTTQPKGHPKPQRKKPKQTPGAAPPPLRAYRADIDLLNERISNLPNASSKNVRHNWPIRIVYYDSFKDHPTPVRAEPWQESDEPPPFSEFYNTLRNIRSGCVQRLILIEDVSPSLIDLLGATFQVPPYLFEHHLANSGFGMTLDDQETSINWITKALTREYTSITWYRPALPHFRLSRKVHDRLIMNQKPKVPCSDKSHSGHDIRIYTLSNILRRTLQLWPEPTITSEVSQDEYPIGWEERATIWNTFVKGCKIVIVLLDPLPVVGVSGKRVGSAPHPSVPLVSENTLDSEQVKTDSKAAQITNWIPSPRELSISESMNHSLSSLSIAPDMVRSGQRVQQSSMMSQSIDSSQGEQRQDQPALVEPHTVTDASSSSIHSIVRLSPNDQPYTTGADANLSDEAFVTLRKRATANNMGNDSSKKPKDNQPRFPRGTEKVRAWTRPVQTTAEPTLPETHEPFVIYRPIRTRASSMGPPGDAGTALRMLEYVINLQLPRSTLDEFEYFVSFPSKGKEKLWDPLQALLLTIHDDTLGLVDVLRVSLSRIREGMLDEDLMQRRVTFWRGLLHRLNFSLADLDQCLEEFVQFVYNSDRDTFSSHTRADIPSEMWAKTTRHRLQNAIDLIDKTSDSLRAEMQIVDSRRSIAEAESVAKLTELAFVFIPLSFVASLFSMQVKELGGGVPLYAFIIGAIIAVMTAYTVRLSIRSTRLVRFRDKALDQIRENANLHSKDPIPTHTFFAWVGVKLFHLVFGPKGLFSFTLTLAAIAAILSPIIILWLRDIDKGFTAMMTVLMLLLDFLLIYPIAISMKDGSHILALFDFKAFMNEIKRNIELKRRVKEKERRKKKQEAGQDVESQGVGYSGESRSSADVSGNEANRHEDNLRKRWTQFNERRLSSIAG